MNRLGPMLALAAAFLAAGAARADEITLLFGTSTPPNTHISLRVFHPWADRINEEGKGLVRIDVRDGMTIASPANFYSRVLDDVIQIGWGSQSNVPGTFPLSEFSTMPFVAERSEDASVAFWRLYRSGLFNAEFKDIVPLVLMVYPQAQIHLAKTPASIANLDGLRMMVVAKTAADVVTRLGGSPISLPLTDLYEGLQRGTVDGAVIAWTAFQPFRLAEVTSYHYETELGAAPGMVFMAKKRYEALPAAVRKIIDGNSGEAESRILGRAWDEVAEEALDAAKADPRATVRYPTAAETTKWEQLVAPVTASWAQSTPGGGKVLADFRATLAAVKAGR